MASLTSFLIIFMATFSVVSFPSASIPVESVNRAADILADSGYLSMSLTLELVSQKLLSNASSATLFSPSDDAFSFSGQPSLSLLHLHFSPLAYSFTDLQFLPFGSLIPVLSPARSLIVTTLPSDDHVSINNLNIHGSPIYDDGSLIVFGIADFFDTDDFKIPSPSPNFQPPSPNFQPPSPNFQPPSPNFQCPVYSTDASFTEAADSIRSQGFSVMASFLDLQGLQFDDHATHFTVFAPYDEALKKRIRDFTGLGSLFRQHVAPCELSLSDLTNLVDGPGLTTLMEGFFLNVARSTDLLNLNGVPVVLPEIYHGDRLTVHGIQDVLLMPQASAAPNSGEGFVVDEL